MVASFDQISLARIFSMRLDLGRRPAEGERQDRFEGLRLSRRGRRRLEVALVGYPCVRVSRKMKPVFRRSSRSSCETRPRAALQKRPSGRSRSPRDDPSTMTSPATGPSTQISQGARGAIEATGARELHNHSPP